MAKIHAMYYQALFKGSEMTKNQLAHTLAKRHGLTKLFARKLVDDLFDIIAIEVQNGKEVRINNFGRFYQLDYTKRFKIDMRGNKLSGVSRIRKIGFKGSKQWIRKAEIK